MRCMASLVAVLALGSLLAPGAFGAAGKSGHFTGAFFGSPGTTFSFSLAKSRLRLEVEADDEGQVTVAISDGPRVNVYLAPGTVSKEGEIDSALGRFGRVAMEFRPRGRPKFEKPFPGCHGKPTVTQAGVFVGRFRFRGERDFAEFEAGHAGGEMVTTSRWHCRHEGGGGEAPETEPSEEAVLRAQVPNGHLSFYAAGHRRAVLRGTSFIASEASRMGRVFEVRDAFALSKSKKAFEFDPALTSATVRPGWPFHGTGVFEDLDGGATWTGSLSVSFLGGQASLTGSRFEAGLSRPKTVEGGSFTGSFFRIQRFLRRVERRPLSLP